MLILGQAPSCDVMASHATCEATTSHPSPTSSSKCGGACPTKPSVHQMLSTIICPALLTHLNKPSSATLQPKREPIVGLRASQFFSWGVVSIITMAENQW